MLIASNRAAMVRSHSRRLEGFTLMELMVVVIIIMISVAIAIPTLSDAFAERRTNEAALDLVRVARRGRAEANAYGRAYLLRYNKAYNAPLGGVRLYRGINTGCSTNPIMWDTVAGEGPECAGNPYCVDDVDMRKYQRDQSDVRVTVAGMGDQVDLCFEPSGNMRWRNGGGATAFINSNTGGLNGGLIYNFTRYESGTQEGVVRQVAFPYGGDARIRR